MPPRRSTCDDVLVRKPAADLFHEAARRLRVDPTRCLVFDDAPAGLVAAHSAGMLTAAVGPAAKNRGAAADSPSVDWALRDISSFDTRCAPHAARPSAALIVGVASGVCTRTSLHNII